MTEGEFTMIVRTTKKVVLSAINNHLSPRFNHAIDDVAQEPYIRAYRNLKMDKFRGDSSIETWLYSIARNEALRMNGRLLKEEEKFKKSARRFEENTGADDAPFNEEIHDLHESIRTLPEKYRNVMELTAAGLSVQEISSKLKIKSGTVKSRSSRGRELLHKILAGGQT